jgi:hypothetical protein
MHKWIAGSTCAAVVLSLAIASAQTYPSRTDAKRAANNTQRITVTGCVTQGILTHATTSNEPASRSGSPSNEGTTATNRNGTAGIGVAGSTSTVTGTSGTNTSIGGIDTEAYGRGALGATDQKGSTSAPERRLVRQQKRPARRVRARRAR